MAWFAVYETATGRLVSVAEVVADAPVLAAAGYTAVAAPTYQPGVAQSWNPTTHDFAAAPLMIVLDRERFFRLFTEAERAALRNSTDEKIKDFIWMLSLATSVTLTETRMVQALTYLVNQGVLTVPRAQAIGQGLEP